MAEEKQGKAFDDFTYREGVKDVTLQFNNRGDVIRVVVDYLEPQPRHAFMRTEALIIPQQMRQTGGQGQVPFVPMNKPPCGGR